MVSFAPGDRLVCKWRAGDERECEVLERREVSGGTEYYVHFLTQNRRLDEWVPASRLLPMEQRANSVDRKRKFDLVAAPSEETAGELDPATRREHEAATRVKNIEKIVLGKWEIQTW